MRLGVDDPIWCFILIALSRESHAPCSRVRSRDSLGVAIHARTHAIAVAAPASGRSVAVGVLLMSPSSGVFCSHVGREGDGGGVACSSHTPYSIRSLVCLRALAVLEAAGSRAFEADG